MTALAWRAGLQMVAAFAGRRHSVMAAHAVVDDIQVHKACPGPRFGGVASAACFVGGYVCGGLCGGGAVAALAMASLTGPRGSLEYATDMAAFTACFGVSSIEGESGLGMPGLSHRLCASKARAHQQEQDPRRAQHDASEQVKPCQHLRSREWQPCARSGVHVSRLSCVGKNPITIESVCG